MMKLRTGAVLSFLLLGGWVSLAAQTQLASFTGTISGTDGKPVANVEVVATNTATQVTYTARSNAAGLYTISALPIGTYKIRAQAEGFQVSETNAITLETGQNARVDFTMQTGFQQTVEVPASRPSSRRRTPSSAKWCRRRRFAACRSTAATSLNCRS